MAMYDLIDQYKELLDRKDQLEEATKENNKAIEAARKELAQAMIDEESPTVSRGGFIYSLQDKTKYSKKSCDEEAFFDTLENAGLGSLIKRTVNAQSLNSAMREIAENNDDELPEEFADYINVYQYYDIGKRKETNKAAKKAKNKEE